MLAEFLVISPIGRFCNRQFLKLINFIEHMNNKQNIELYVYYIHICSYLGEGAGKAWL